MRLDTTMDEGAKWAIEHNYFVDKDDPGASETIDLCWHCVENNGLSDVAEAEHPPYEYDDYKCLLCGQPLDDVND